MKISYRQLKRENLILKHKINEMYKEFTYTAAKLYIVQPDDLIFDGMEEQFLGDIKVMVEFLKKGEKKDEKDNNNTVNSDNVNIVQ